MPHNIIPLFSELNPRRSNIDVSANPTFKRSDAFHQIGAMTAQTVLNQASNLGYIDLAKIKKILDFGAGVGGPTITLAHLAESNGGKAEAVDTSPVFAEFIAKLGILPPEYVHQGDGIELLSSADAQNTYDLITAFMLGPDGRGELIGNLIESSQRALTENGRLVITSDPMTMSTARRCCEQAGVVCNFVTGLPSTTSIVPDAMVISFDPK